MRATLVFALLSLAGTAAAAPATAKLFTDKGSTYLRIDKGPKPVIGDELDAATDADGKQPVGKAVVMELTGKLCRVSLDEDATKGGAKFVVLPQPKKGGAAAAASPGAPAPSSGGPAIIPDVSPIKRGEGPPLKGNLELSGLRFAFANDTDESWTGCKLHHSDGSSYEVGEVVKHTDDAVMRVKLTGAWSPLYDHLNVICAEGEGQFFFARPNEPRGKLKGYATDDGKGSVVVYNQNDTAWTACDVKKPDGSHFVLGNLKGHDSDSIDRGRFKKEAEAPGPKWIELRCKQGLLHTEL